MNVLDEEIASAQADPEKVRQYAAGDSDFDAVRDDLRMLMQIGAVPGAVPAT